MLKVKHPILVQPLSCLNALLLLSVFAATQPLSNDFYFLCKQQFTFYEV